MAPLDMSRQATARRVRNAMPPLPFTGLTPTEYGRHMDRIVNDVMAARRNPRNPYIDRGLGVLQFPSSTTAPASTTLDGTAEAGAGGTQNA